MCIVYIRDSRGEYIWGAKVVYVYQSVRVGIYYLGYVIRNTEEAASSKLTKFLSDFMLLTAFLPLLKAF